MTGQEDIPKRDIYEAIFQEYGVQALIDNLHQKDKEIELLTARIKSKDAEISQLNDIIYPKPSELSVMDLWNM